jgi:hypothetical protein
MANNFIIRLIFLMILEFGQKRTKGKRRKESRLKSLSKPVLNDSARNKPNICQRKNTMNRKNKIAALLLVIRSFLNPDLFSIIQDKTHIIITAGR